MSDAIETFDIRVDDAMLDDLGLNPTGRRP
jgi:hypothetical protein